MSEIAIKEDLFFTLSGSMDKDEAIQETERISLLFKKLYSTNEDTPIIGTDTYRYFIDHNTGGWEQNHESRIDKYINGEWKLFMYFNDGLSMMGGFKCKKIIKRLIAGGNTVMEY